ncbi:MAG: hypothetical protein ABL901_02785 [Hyphomicrobiaceae bacterium]|nr:hypothetical protein [Hyphomicrobiaceae bacterium]
MIDPRRSASNVVATLWTVLIGSVVAVWAFQSRPLPAALIIELLLLVVVWLAIKGLCDVIDEVGDWLRARRRNRLLGKMYREAMKK